MQLGNLKKNPVFNKILIINPFGIGDVLFTTPIIHTLKDAFPQLKLGYLCNGRTQGIIKNNPYIDIVYVYDRDEFNEVRKQSFLAWIKKEVTFLGQIKKEAFDLALDFSLNQQFGFFSWYAGIRKRVGFNFKKRGRFLTHKISLNGYNDKHIVEYYCELLKLLEIDLKYRRLELYLKQEDLQKAELILNNQGIGQSEALVGIIPGAGKSWGKDAYLKHWTSEKFAQLADKLVENYKLKIIILGDFSEKNIAKRVCDDMRNQALDLTGKTTVGELAALLSKTKLVITNDGGPLHMAVAQGVKTVSIFGPVDEKVYGPYPASSQHMVVSNKSIDCRPCYKNFRFGGCSYDRKCIKDISVDDVFTAVRRLM